jgi:NMD protein affecting ribosome stability and mRNA decay
MPRRIRLTEIKACAAPPANVDVMKTDRGSFRMLERKQLLQEVVHDSYKPKRKLAGPARCPDCGAVYRRGRWRWGAAPPGSRPTRCPACHRIRDRLPGGTVRLRGSFFDRHRDEILGRVRHCEQAESRAHPLQRIIAAAADGAGLLVTTTDAHLARRIGEALHNAYKGELDYRYNKQDNLLRVGWTR